MMSMRVNCARLLSVMIVCHRARLIFAKLKMIRDINQISATLNI